MTGTPEHEVDAALARAAWAIRNDRADLDVDPRTEAKALPCEHGQYRWNACESCALEAVAEWLDRGAPEW